MDPNLLERLNTVRERFAHNAFGQWLGVELTAVSEEKIELALSLRPEHRQNVGFAHGGVLATLADIAMGFAAVAQTQAGNHVLTVDLQIRYLNPAIGPLLTVVGYPIKSGRKLVFTEAEIYSHHNQVPQLCCKASATMAVVQTTDIKK